MPIYEYRCEECEKVTEILQRKSTVGGEIICPFCGSSRMKKQISSFSSVISNKPSLKGKTCCGKDQRCDTPPCSDEGVCRRDSQTSWKIY